MLGLVALVGEFLASVTGMFTVGTTAVLGWFTVETGKMIAKKAMWLFLICVVWPVVMYNVSMEIIFDLMDAVLTIANSHLAEYGTSAAPLTLQFTSLGGWIAEQIFLPQCISIFLAALGIKFIFAFLPFARL